MARATIAAAAVVLIAAGCARSTSAPPDAAEGDLPREALDFRVEG